MVRSRPIVDADAHAVEDYDGFLALLEPSLRPVAPQFETDGRGVARLVAIEGRPWKPLFPFTLTDGLRRRHQGIGRAGTDVAERVRVLDEEGIDISVVLPSLGLYFGLYRNPEIAAAMCRAENRWLGAWCGQAPDRLAPVAVLPQQDPSLAAAELARAVEHDGAVGGLVRPNPSGGRRVDADDFDILWRTAVDLDVPVIFHEGWVGGGYPTLGMDRAGSYAAAHAMSHPFEAMSAILGVARSGVLARFSALRLGFFEAGCGWAPWWEARLADHADLRPDDFASGMPDLSHRVWLTVEPTESAAAWVATTGWGANLCFATDFPHLDATYPGAVTRARELGLPSELEGQLLGENAVTLFGSRLRSRLRPNTAITRRGPRLTVSDAESRPTDGDYQRKRDFLLARGGAGLSHSGQSLLRHLEATASILAAWSARPALCDAGLFHSVYGTESFAGAIASVADRTEVRALISDEAEDLTWMFGKCSQQSIVEWATETSPLLDSAGGDLAVPASQRRDLCELVVANWLEQRPRLDADRQRDLLTAARALERWISPAARSALALASEVEPDDQALRRWVANSHRVITISFGGGPRPLPSFEPRQVLASERTMQVLGSISARLRECSWDNTRTEDPAGRLALREPVAVDELTGWLGESGVEDLLTTGAAQLSDPESGRVTLSIGLAAIGPEIVVVPADGKRLDGVYFGIEPLLLDTLARAATSAVVSDQGGPAGLRVLECGAGAGLASVLAARRSTAIASDVLDRAAAFVGLTRALNPHLASRLHPVVADGAAGLRPSSFDLVLSNPPLVPGRTGLEQALYSYGGPTGTELPVRLLGETLPLLRPGGCLVMLTLDSILHDGRRPVAEALAGLGDGFCWGRWRSPWPYFAPTATPRLLVEHADVLADAEHVGLIVISTPRGAGAADRSRLEFAAAALAGSGWALSALSPI